MQNPKFKMQNVELRAENHNRSCLIISINDGELFFDEATDDSGC